MRIALARRAWQALLLGNWILILLFWWNGSGADLLAGPSTASIAVGRLFGLGATYMILLQFFFMGRMPYLERVFGLDRLSRLHHQNGRYGIILLLLHPILITAGYGAFSQQGFMGQALQFLSVGSILLAAIGLLLFLAVVGTSIWIVRRRLRYESWYAVHLIAYLAVFLALPHQLSLGTTVNGTTLFYGYWILLYTAVFASHLAFRFARPFVLMRRHRFAVSDIVRENNNTVSVIITGKNLERFKIRPGQFMIVRFLAKGFVWQAHPFSLSMMPDGKKLRITVKELGDFTRTIAAIPTGTRVLVDGPYGVFTDLFSVCPKVLFVAGGIGITPIRSLMEEMVRKGKDAVLLYGNKTVGDIVFREELQAVAMKHRARVVHIISDGNAGSLPAAETGRIDAEKIRRLVPDLRERDIYLCGPPPMMDALIRVFRDLGVPPKRLHWERFSL